MEPLRARELITSQQLAALRLGRFFSDTWASRYSKMQDERASEPPPSQTMDTTVYRLGALAWLTATTAQDCAYLAEQLQIAAELFSDSQIECRESTYKQLYDSIETLGLLLRTMRQKFAGTCEQEDVSDLLVLSSAVSEAIHSILVLELASGTAESMTSTASQETSSI